MAASAAEADKATGTVNKLAKSSAEIGGIVKIISSVAAQTNLLALNATIEAARAGEAGKGFAVVASEVKGLAQETSKSTQDINSKIAAIREDTNEATGAIGEIVQFIDKVNDVIGAIAAAVEEQTATTSEITRHVTEAARISAEIAQRFQQQAVATSNGEVGKGGIPENSDKSSKPWSQQPALKKRQNGDRLHGT